jgi:hypothetical protein
MNWWPTKAKAHEIANHESKKAKHETHESQSG